MWLIKEFDITAIRSFYPILKLADLTNLIIIIIIAYSAISTSIVFLTNTHNLIICTDFFPISFHFFHTV